MSELQAAVFVHGIDRWERFCRSWRHIAMEAAINVGGWKLKNA